MTVDPLLVAADRLTALADAATQGERVVEISGGTDFTGEGWATVEVGFGPQSEFQRNGCMLGDHEQAEADADFIAAVDPSVARAVAELLREIYRQHFEEIAGCCWTCSGEMNWPCVTYQAGLAVATTLGAS